jgi:hypothetical protein
VHRPGSVEKGQVAETRSDRFTLKENTHKRSNLDDFVACCFGVGASLDDARSGKGAREARPYY